MPLAGQADSADRVAETPARRQSFAETRWSVIVRAGRQADPRSSEALASLCQSYWYPLYAHVRRRGYSQHDAQDLTQGFFAQLLQRESIASADRLRGRFRTFLLTALDRYMTDEWHRSHAMKRGGATDIVSLHLAAAERRFGAEPADESSPDRAFDRQWALALLESVLSRLEAEFSSTGRAALFKILRPTLTGSRESQPYTELATALSLSEGAVKVAVHRLRQRYRDLLRQEIRETVAASEDEADELQHLLRALAG